MEESVPEPVTWREVADPEYGWLMWRCRALVLEITLVHQPSRWSSSHKMFPHAWVSTPDREAVWKQLFLNP